ncbi:hypothetical protein SAY86_031597 [Trapa natans]|uniref:Ternary complex factor MIP1 leucine-zipper domain-containing protein n=1 Tax=Trapa natans TaxID=22666 RepID=A0AAN7LT38_TRANT|nr:hypothetical protein SAY86_031597 [Trapa natans]
MNSRTRISEQPTKSTSVHDKKKKIEKSGSDFFGPEKTGIDLRNLKREKKLALLQDVDSLKKKLRYEENVHRVLERALTRPLGSLPRLPPYLPPHTLELLAEVAVLEEEIVRLEEQLLNFRRGGLYKEAVYQSSKRNAENSSYPMDDCPARRAKYDPSKTSSRREFSSLTFNLRSSPSMRSTSGRKLLSSLDPVLVRSENSSSMANGRPSLKKLNSCLSPIPEEIHGKENCSFVNSTEETHIRGKNGPNTPVKRTLIKKQYSFESTPDPVKLQVLRMRIY